MRDQGGATAADPVRELTSAGRAAQRRERRTDGAEVAGTEVPGYRARLRFGGSPPQHADAFPAPFNSRLPFSPPSFQAVLLSLAGSHGCGSTPSRRRQVFVMGCEGNMTGGRMRPMSKAGNHAEQQATLRLLWKSPHVMRSGAPRNALHSRTCVNAPVAGGDANGQ